MPRRRRDKPIESVALKITFRADRTTSNRIREALPSAILRNGVCVVQVEGQEPGEVAGKAKEIMEKLRPIIHNPKGFN